MNGAGLRALLLATLATAVLLEIVARWSFPLREIENFDRMAYAPMLAGADITGTTLHHASFSWHSDPDGASFVHHLNQYGFRDIEWRVAKSQGVRRVAFVGDSFVEGFMARDDESIPSVFRQLSR